MRSSHTEYSSVPLRYQRRNKYVARTDLLWKYFIFWPFFSEKREKYPCNCLFLPQSYNLELSFFFFSTSGSNRATPHTERKCTSCLWLLIWARQLKSCESCQPSLMNLLAVGWRLMLSSQIYSSQRSKYQRDLHSRLFVFYRTFQIVEAFFHRSSMMLRVVYLVYSV